MNLSKKKSKSHHEALLGLLTVHSLGVQRIRMLLQTVEHPAEVFCLSRAELGTIDGIGPATAQQIMDFDGWDEVDRILTQTERTGAQLLSYYDDAYPNLLRQIFDPPILLWVKGRIEVLGASGAAIVGTRRATHYGKKMARRFSEGFVEYGLTVVSGLAFGVDAVAHQTAIDSGGKTIAVLGSGIDVIYPQKHAGLASDIIETGGAMISEFPPGTPPDAGNFPVRNRIVSGLTFGTLVVESDIKGGSMITAQSALTQNREVFVVPHSLENVNGRGCNHLIKRSAGKLVQTIDDIIEELPQFVKEPTQAHPAKPKEARWKELELDEKSRTICQLLEKESMHIDDMADALDKNAHELLPVLLELEMQQCVRQTAGKNFELV